MINVLLGPHVIEPEGMSRQMAVSRCMQEPKDSTACLLDPM